MSKIGLTDATTLTNETTFISTLNANYASIKAASDNTLSRDGTSPNSMAADFDMNSYKILNIGDLDMNSHRITSLPNATASTEPVTLSQFESGVGSTGAAPATASYVTLGTSSGLSAERVLTAGNNITLTDNGANGTLVVASTSSGSGDVVGPASAVNNDVVLFNGTTGKLVKDSGLTLSGTNTGDQTITLTGNVTGSGTGSFATTIANNAVTLAKMAQIGSGNFLLGRATGGAGNPELLTVGSSLNLNSITTILDREALTGDVTCPRASNTTTIANYATQAQAETGTSTTTVMSPLRVSEAIVSLGQNFKNVVGRNGGLEIWQRLVNAGTTIAVAASTTAYTVDGWYLSTAASQASTITQVAGLTSNSRYAARVQRNSGQTGTGAMVFAFPLDIDELLKLNGKTAVLSFYVATGANWSPTSGTLTWKLYCGTGAVAKRNASAYTGETNPISGSVNLSTGASAALQVSAISSAIGSTITQAELQFTWTPTGTAGANDWFSIDDVQLEVCLDGVAPVTPLFERSDYIWDLQRCQRHLPVYNASAAASTPFGFGGAFSTTQAFMMVPLPVQTRAVLTGITVSNATHFNASNSAAANIAATAVTWIGSGNQGISQSSALVIVGVASGLVAGNASAITSTNIAAQMLFTGAEI